MIKSLVSTLVIALLMPFAASAGFMSSDTIAADGAGKILQDGKGYVVPTDTTLTRTTPYAALYVKANTTAVIYIPKGVTLIQAKRTFKCELPNYREVTRGETRTGT